MIKGTTRSGFAYEIQDEALNDFELLEQLSDLEDNPLYLPKVITKLFGDKQKKALLDHVRKDDGIVPVDLLSVELEDIFRGKDLKNSPTSPGSSKTKKTT